MTDHRNGPRKGRAFGLLVFVLFGVAPVLGLGYIVIRFVLGLAGVELPGVQTSVQ